MTDAVTEYIEQAAQKPGQEWQGPICESLRAMTLTALPGAEERIQYGRPHYLVNGSYAAVMSTAKGWVAYMIFNAAELDPPAGLFEKGGPPERRTIKIKPGQTVDYAQLGSLLKSATATIGG
jgi:hypothetical protein